MITHAKSGYTAIDLHRDIADNFANLSSFTPSIVTVMSLSSAHSVSSQSAGFDQHLVVSDLKIFRGGIVFYVI